MNISAFAVTDTGMQLGKFLEQKSGGKIVPNLCSEIDLFAFSKEYFSTTDALIFICPLDIAVRVISGHFRSENHEPAVVVLDELGKFTIPICSGHQGIANKLAAVLAGMTEGIPVITTTNDIENQFSIDKWANSVGLRIANPETIKLISTKLLTGETVHFDSIFSIPGEPPKGIELSGAKDLSDFTITYLSSVPDKTLHLVPPVLTLGIDIIEGASCEAIETAYSQFLQECGCHPLSVREVCSIDRNNKDNGLTGFCNKNKIPLTFFSSDDLSADVRLKMPKCMELFAGNYTVCERSAVFGSGGSLFVRNMDFDGISMAMAIKEPDLTE